jgi:uncharacterized membrane protein YhaH (DUF805 family)
MDDNEKTLVEPKHGGGWFTFAGRMRRREYWWKMFLIFSILVGVIILVIAFEFIAKAIYRIDMPADVKSMLAVGIILVTVLCAVLAIPVSVRRLHDLDLSGWWYLAVFFLPRFIPDAPIRSVASIAMIVLLGGIDGTCGPNRFGPDPKGRKAVNREK